MAQPTWPTQPNTQNNHTDNRKNYKGGVKGEWRKRPYKQSNSGPFQSGNTEQMKENTLSRWRLYNDVTMEGGWYDNGSSNTKVYEIASMSSNFDQQIWNRYFGIEYSEMTMNHKWISNNTIVRVKMTKVWNNQSLQVYMRSKILLLLELMI